MIDLKPISNPQFAHPWAGLDMGNLVAVFGVNVMVALVLAVTHYLDSPKEPSTYVIAHIVTTTLTFTWLARLSARDAQRESYRKYLRRQPVEVLEAAQEWPELLTLNSLELIRDALEEKKIPMPPHRGFSTSRAAARRQDAKPFHSQRDSSDYRMSSAAFLASSAGNSSSSSSYCDNGSSTSCGDGGGGC